MKKFIVFLLSALCLLSMVSGFAKVRALVQLSPQEIVQFGSYPQGAAGEVLPIRWKVLEVKDNTAYLMSEQILFAARVHGDQRNYPGFAKSELNVLLNGEFLNAAFTESEQSAMLETELGMVSLPSADDIRNKDYGFKDNGDRCKFIGTAYALNNGLFKYSSRKYSPIWTRTESSKKHANRSTKVDGSVGFIGVESPDLGIMPVIWLKLDRVEARSGSGSLESPVKLEAVQ